MPVKMEMREPIYMQLSRVQLTQHNERAARRPERYERTQGSRHSLKPAKYVHKRIIKVENMHAY
jgi:hypothetical protein